MFENPDKLLFNQIKKGDEKAFSCIFDKYWEELFLSAYRVLNDEEICKDVVQDIFIALWNRSSELEISNLRAYLLQAAKYQVAKFIRDNQKIDIISNSYEKIEMLCYTEQPVEYNELFGVLNQKINELPERCRQVFRMSRIDGLTNKQIGEKLDISVSTVENQISKALKFIRHELSGYTTFLSLVVFFFL